MKRLQVLEDDDDDDVIPLAKSPGEPKKRVPLTTISTPATLGSSSPKTDANGSTSRTGRRVNLITLNSALSDSKKN